MLLAEWQIDMKEYEMMIRKLVLTISTIFTLLLSLNTAQAAEWTADFVKTDGQMRDVSKVYIKGDKRREEMTHRGQTESIVLFNPGSHQIITLMPSERMFMEIPMSPDQEMFSKGPGSDLASGKPLGTEKISGYLCDKYHQESAEGAVTVWVSRKLQYPIRIEVMDLDGGKSVMTYENIQEKSLPDSLFSVPAGYNKFSIPGMPAGMPMMPRMR
ncbi:hypothetical protein DJ030_03830 [bacterium endosymbiont of Escarpia laminata]|nr:MAG: hypothetical protein DJ030_03830 [bacterium endosymbiont of Escarpia laminata]